MFESKKVSDILSELVKYGIVADFAVNNNEEKYEVILYNSDDSECIINNFKNIGFTAVVGENPELLNVYFSNNGVINSIFKKYY